MELEELKLAWQTLDRRLDRLTTLELGRQRETRLEAAQKHFRSLTRGQVLQIVIGGLLCLLFAPYWAAHWQVPHLAFYGLALHGYGLMFVVLAVRTLVLIQRIDYASPVLTIQRRMAELVDWKLRVEGPAFAMVGCFIWIPLVLILFRAVGVDLWQSAPGVVYSFIASGSACLVLVRFALKTMDGVESRKGRWAASFRNSTIGRSILRAQVQLDELARFERD